MEEGEPDGTSGQVYLNCMSPEPENDYVCDILTTDPDGYARHSDTRYYNYSKTYCMGHPAPEWTECDHEEDEDCSCDEEMTGFADSGGQNRNCVQPLVISMP